MKLLANLSTKIAPIPESLVRALRAQLGVGSTDPERAAPRQVAIVVALLVASAGLVLGPRTSPAAAPPSPVAIAAGHFDGCVVLDGGALKCWGDNFDGQLGLGDTEDRGDGPNEMGGNLPAVALGTSRTAVAVDPGGNHTCALLDDATVKCWGSNDDGQLGQGDTAYRGDAAGEMGDSLPAVALGTGRTAVAIAAGWDHSCAVLDDGTVKCWGANDDGQLGLGDTADRGDGPGEMGDGLPVVALGTGRTAVAITANYAYTCALLDDGTVKCWGANFNGQLGLGTRWTEVTARARWGTACRPSRSAPAVPQSRSPPAHNIRAQFWTMRR
jgi:alpha-tubulin suppressor-like RCC1 family protein